MSIPFDRKKSHPKALSTSKYGLRRTELLKACAGRELLLVKRNSFVYAFRAGQVTFVAFVLMTLFQRSNMKKQSITDGEIYFGSLFYLIIIIMFNGLSEISLTIFKLPIFFKQRDNNFYPSWAYTIPTWILKMPFSFTEAAILVLINYYGIGYDPSIARFLKCYLLLIIIHQVVAGLFRFIASIGKIIVVANVLGSLTINFFTTLGGFLIAHDDMKKWWVWGYWVSPLMYSQNAISVNEFLGKSWNRMTPNSNQTLGIQILRSHGMFLEENWYWVGAGALLIYVVLFNFLFTLALSYFKTPGRDQPLVSKAAFSEKRICITGNVDDSSLKRKNSTNKYEYKTKESSLDERKGMVLPFIPITVSFENISYSVDMPQEIKAQGSNEERLMLLNDVSGCFRPGILTALMGVSGAGKTTLMDVLSGRKMGGYINGSISINGYPKKQETFTRVLGYCEQYDIHTSNITVYESLVFSAWLRLPLEVDTTTRKMFIEEIMELVELRTIRKALVGLPEEGKGLTLEQRKRLTIAVEIVANPSIIFMDEPTSGLDARAAAIVMRTVRNIVDTKRTVLCTIHQPSIDIFETFDELFLLKRGGKEIYVGPLGHHSSHLIKYFEGIQGVREIKIGHNPATWMLEESTTTKEKALKIDFNEVYRNSELYQRNKEMIKENSIPISGSSDLHFPTLYSQAFLTQCIACLWKQRLSYWRNPLYTCLRFFFTVFIALLFGTIFWDLGNKRGKEQDLHNIIGFMYITVMFLGIAYSTGVQPIVAFERTVFYRERLAGMYSAIPFAFGQVIIEQPYILVQSLIYSLIVYSMIGFERTMAKFFWYVFFTYFTLLYFTYYGMLAVALTPNHTIAVIASSIFYGLWNMFSGFIIPQTKMPLWWRWYYRACPTSWTLYGLIESQFGDDIRSLDTNQTVAQYIRIYFGFKHEFLGVVAAVVVFFGVLFSGLFVVAIKLLNFHRK